MGNPMFSYPAFRGAEPDNENENDDSEYDGEDHRYSEGWK